MFGLDSILGGGGLSAGQATGSFGPNASGPVVVNVAGFGSKSSGSATSATSPDAVPAAQQAAGLGGSWAPLLIVGAVFAFLLLQRD